MNLKLLPELHEKPFVCVIFAIVIIYMARRARDSFPMLQAEKVSQNILIKMLLTTVAKDKLMRNSHVILC